MLLPESRRKSLFSSASFTMGKDKELNDNKLNNKDLKTILIDEVLDELRIKNINAFKKYLSHIFRELTSREKTKFFTKILFKKYYNLPGIIFDRLYKTLVKTKEKRIINQFGIDEQNKSKENQNNNRKRNLNDVDETLTEENFIEGMTTLFYKSYEEITKFIFDFYDFDNNNKVQKENIRIILSYITLSNKNIKENKLNGDSKIDSLGYYNRVTSQEQIHTILGKIFNNIVEFLDYARFLDVIDNKSCDIFLIIYLFLYENRPFNQETVNEFIDDKEPLINKVISLDINNTASSHKKVAAPSDFRTFSPFKLYNNIKKRRESLCVEKTSAFKNNLFPNKLINGSSGGGTPKKSINHGPIQSALNNNFTSQQLNYSSLKTKKNENESSGIEPIDLLNSNLSNIHNLESLTHVKRCSIKDPKNGLYGNLHLNPVFSDINKQKPQRRKRKRITKINIDDANKSEFVESPFDDDGMIKAYKNLHLINDGELINVDEKNDNDSKKQINFHKTKTITSRKNYKDKDQDGNDTNCMGSNLSNLCKNFKKSVMSIDSYKSHSVSSREVDSPNSSFIREESVKYIPLGKINNVGSFNNVLSNHFIKRLSISASDNENKKEEISFQTYNNKSGLTKSNLESIKSFSSDEESKSSEGDDDDNANYNFFFRKNFQKIKYEDYLYNLNDDDKLEKRYYKLIIKDLFYYKNNANNKKYIGMINLSGAYLEDEPIFTKDLKKYYSFSLQYTNKKRIFYTENKSSYKNWINKLKKVTNYNELFKLYDVSNKEIGSGQFGVVKLGNLKQKGKNSFNNIEKVAIKVLNKKSMTSEDLQLVITEIEIMKICQHPNIIHLYNVFEDIDNFYIVMEYCEQGDLYSFLEKRSFLLSEKSTCDLINKLCTAVYYIHSYGVVHRDLKPENILIKDYKKTNENNNEIFEQIDLRILDFGLSKILEPKEKCSEPFGTICYVAPEILLEEPYDKKVDIWSIGVITYMMLCGELPYDDSEDEEAIGKKTVLQQPNFSGDTWSQISEEGKKFVKDCLRKNPTYRLDIVKCLEHEWFKKYFKGIVKNRRDSFNGIREFQAFSGSGFFN